MSLYLFLYKRPGKPYFFSGLPGLKAGKTNCASMRQPTVNIE
jgi:hypothetical protein